MAITFPSAGDTASQEGTTARRPMDESEFRALYLSAAPQLWNYIRHACGDAALADDILQETFYKFLRADLPSMDDAQAKAYLYRTSSTLLADYWRRAKRERRWSLAGFLGAETAGAPQPEGDAMRAFAKLKPQDQSLLWLAYVEGFSHNEIASALGLREKSVRVLLFRARRKLAGILGAQGFSLEMK